MEPSPLLSLPTELQIQIFEHAIQPWSLSLRLSRMCEGVKPFVSGELRRNKPLVRQGCNDRLYLSMNSDLNTYLTYLWAIPTLRNVILKVLRDQFTGMTYLSFDLGGHILPLKSWHIPINLQDIVIPLTKIVTILGTEGCAESPITNLFPNTEEVRHYVQSLPQSMISSYQHNTMKVRSEVLTDQWDKVFLIEARKEAFFQNLRLKNLNLDSAQKLPHAYFWLWRLADSEDVSVTYLLVRTSVDNLNLWTEPSQINKEFIHADDVSKWDDTAKAWRRVGYYDIKNPGLPPFPGTRMEVRYKDPLNGCIRSYFYNKDVSQPSEL